MSKIEKIKHDGAVAALRNRIQDLKFALTNRNWDSISENGKFCRLAEAIENAGNILEEMKETFAALREMEPGNK